MAPALNLEVIKDGVMQTLLSLVADPIPNIRFNVAKAFWLTVMAIFHDTTKGNIGFCKPEGAS